MAKAITTPKEIAAHRFSNSAKVRRICLKLAVPLCPIWKLEYNKETKTTPQSILKNALLIELIFF